MKITELSIGDWVRYDRGTDAVQIMGIYVRNNQECVVMSDSYFPDGVIGFVEHISPIPLTPKILEKNGWHDYISKYNDDVEDVCYENGDIIAHSFSSIYFKGGEYYFGEESGYFKTLTIKYVHQLQNALRLAGVEKEIII